MADLDLALKEGRVHLPPLVLSELLSARLKPTERSALESFLCELPLIDAPFEHWSRVGHFRAQCSASGLHLSTPDAHIAQCAIDLDGYLMSADKIFSKVAASTALRLFSLVR